MHSNRLRLIYIKISLLKRKRILHSTEIQQFKLQCEYVHWIFFDTHIHTHRPNDNDTSFNGIGKDPIKVENVVSALQY